MKMISIRIPVDMLSQADRLAATSTPTATRAALLRAAIARGLIDLRAERHAEPERNAR